MSSGTGRHYGSDSQEMEPPPAHRSIGRRLRNLVIGKARSPHDPTLFHKLSLIAFFAWIGLGADGLSSSCYGPEEAFLALGQHGHLALFVALGTVLTIFVISTSYSQIIELFPAGGGGYVVASKLLSPTFGTISGCALLVDYMLTITLSVASGADALFSFLSPQWQSFKLAFAVFGVLVLIVLNLRGVKESIIPLIPIFLLFIATHAFILLYGLGSHIGNLPDVVSGTLTDVQRTKSELGLAGMILLILRSYSFGAGTYTGIEAVSNGLPILREPKVHTGKRTMRMMAISLALTTLGIMLVYLLYSVEPQQGKTLNAVVFERITTGWSGNTGYIVVLLTLISEAVLLFVAAQTGFLDGPRVMANMALDRRFPTRFAALSDRFVTQNGILLMGGASLILMLATRGSVRFLVVLYSINVFLTFFLSQLGMVRHWWKVRKEAGKWMRKLSINGIGLILTGFILATVIVLKFHEGGWITLLITGGMVCGVMLIKRHYSKAQRMLRRLDGLVEAAESSAGVISAGEAGSAPSSASFDPKSKTAVIFVNGYNGLGLHTLFSVFRLFGSTFRNFVFVQVGMIDAGIFKGSSEISALQAHIKNELDRYVDLLKRNGYHAEHFSAVGNDVVNEVIALTPQILKRFPQATFFGGQIVFPEDTFITRILHNYTIFSIQRRFYHQGIPLVILPIRV